MMIPQISMVLMVVVVTTLGLGARTTEGADTIRVSVATGDLEANGGSGDPALSADGRVVAFMSGATNLVPGDTNGNADVYVHELSQIPLPFKEPPEHRPLGP